MNLLKTLLLTVAPPIIGLSSYYRSIYDYTIVDLAVIIGMQLYFVEWRWLLISFILNAWLVYSLEKKHEDKTV